MRSVYPETTSATSTRHPPRRRSGHTISRQQHATCLQLDELRVGASSLDDCFGRAPNRVGRSPLSRSLDFAALRSGSLLISRRLAVLATLARADIDALAIVHL